MTELVVDSLQATGNTLEATITVPAELRRFFTGDPLRVEYPRSIESVPESILVIPVLAHVCPVAWTRDVDVRAEVVDSRFSAALFDVQEVLQEMYPRFMGTGGLIAERVDTPEPETTDRTAQFFTGGIDSLTTYVRHREEEPALISINGWTEPVADSAWEKRKAMLETYGDTFGVENLFIRSNMLSFIDHTMLIAHFKRYFVGSWYSSVGYGLGLLGLCAPLAYAEGVGTFYVASTASASHDHPWGSHPSIDDNIRWTGTTACHDGFELDRQQKVERLLEYVRTEWPEMPIRTCNEEVDSNCGECEKCARTATSLVLAGQDPNTHGYEWGPADWAPVKDSLRTGSWDIGAAWYDWEAIQNAITADTDYPIEGAAAFFDWLSDVDMEAVRDRSRPPFGKRLLRFATRNTPYPIYSTVYPMYTELTRSDSP